MQEKIYFPLAWENLSVCSWGFRFHFPFTRMQIFIQWAPLDMHPYGSLSRTHIQARTDIQTAELCKRPWAVHSVLSCFQTPAPKYAPLVTSLVSLPVTDTLGVSPKFTMQSFCCLISSLFLWAVTFINDTVKWVVKCIRHKAPSWWQSGFALISDRAIFSSWDGRGPTSVHTTSPLAKWMEVTWHVESWRRAPRPAQDLTRINPCCLLGGEGMEENQWGFTCGFLCISV